MPPCPYCNQSAYPPVPVTFSWWGGLLGPKLLSHATCVQCGKAYNSKTGLPNTNAIIIYSLVLGGLVMFLMFFVFRH